jgi:hypothetical protein
LSSGPHIATSKKTHHNVKEIKDTTRTIIQFPVLLQSNIFKKKLAVINWLPHQHFQKKETGCNQLACTSTFSKRNWL